MSMNRRLQTVLILLIAVIVLGMIPSAAFAEEREFTGALWSKPDGKTEQRSMNSWVYIAVFVAIFLLFAGKKKFGKKKKFEPQMQRKESDYVNLGTLSSLAEIQKRDPDFDEREFAMKAADLFTNVFDAMYGGALAEPERIGKKVLDKIGQAATEHSTEGTPVMKAEVYEATIVSYSQNLINDIVAIQLSVKISDPKSAQSTPRYTYFDLYFVRDNGYMADERTLATEQEWVLSQIRELKR